MRNGNPSIVNPGTSSINAASMTTAINPAGVVAGDGGSDGQLYAPALPEASAAEKAAETARARKLAERYRLEFVDLSQFSIDHDLFRAIPADLMLRYGFVPYHREGHDLVIVVSDPTDLPMIDELAVLLATRIRVTVGTRSAIDAILKKSESSQRVLEEATESFQLQLLREDEAGEDQLTVERLTADSSPVIRLVDTTVYNAIQRRASDIHIETGDDAVHVKYRIDGVLQPAMRPIDKRFHSTIISRVKVMAELDIAEKRVPQDGRFKLRLPGKTIDFRVSVMPSVHGEDAVIRILDKESISEQFRELRLDILGFPEDELRRFRKYIAEPYGMVLVTGPTGSGKTTTLYAALSEIKSIEDKIITIEDPVEYQLRGITQIPINEKKGLTFARGLRSILRHDPDKIMVGEIRDPDTAQIAIQSALTGHLVFTTVHANNVLDVLGRFLNMGVEPYQFVSALNCVMAQRLVRNICTHCKRPASVTRQMLEESAMDPSLEHSGLFFEGGGCIECAGTGFKGRTAICELLDLSDNIREMILERRPTSEIKKAAREEGMRFLRESAVERVLKGITTLREINKVTFVE
jgi:type II secretory ATPase GspE/PulE/Tfp pilus assembly ATPase PilB-like protein